MRLHQASGQGQDQTTVLLQCSRHKQRLGTGLRLSPEAALSRAAALDLVCVTVLLSAILHGTLVRGHSCGACCSWPLHRCRGPTERRRSHSTPVRCVQRHRILRDVEELYALAAMQHNCARRNECKQRLQELPSDANVLVMTTLQTVAGFSKTLHVSPMGTC